MDCPKCNLRYNVANRRPKVHQCGHSLCEQCTNKIKFCHTCQKIIDKSKSNVNFSLLQMLAQKKQTKDIDKLIKVCFIGESIVGKTSLISRLKGEDYKEHTITTIGYDFAFQDRVIDGLNIRFQLWDSAGQERYRAISPLHYKNSDIIVIVYDVTKNGKNNNIGHWMQQANHHCPPTTIKMLVGNKIDLLDQMNSKPLNALDQFTWKTIALQKLTNTQLSCKTYEGIELFWEILQNNVRNILKRVNLGPSPFGSPQKSSDILPLPKPRSTIRAGSPTKLSKKPVQNQSRGCQC